VFGIGATELIVVMVVALLIFGPKRLPELARSLGRGMAEFRRASSDLRQTLQEVETPDESLKPPEPEEAEATTAAAAKAPPSPDAVPDTPADAATDSAKGRDPSPSPQSNDKSDDKSDDESDPRSG